MMIRTRWKKGVMLTLTCNLPHSEQAIMCLPVGCEPSLRIVSRVVAVFRVFDLIDLRRCSGRGLKQGEAVSLREEESESHAKTGHEASARSAEGHNKEKQEREFGRTWKAFWC